MIGSRHGLREIATTQFLIVDRLNRLEPNSAADRCRGTLRRLDCDIALVGIEDVVDLTRGWCAVLLSCGPSR